VNDFTEFVDPLPIAIVVEEPAAVACLQVFRGVGTGLSHIDLNPSPKGLNMIFE
jgi:hypothetical protein